MATISSFDLDRVMTAIDKLERPDAHSRRGCDVTQAIRDLDPAGLCSVCAAYYYVGQAMYELMFSYERLGHPIEGDTFEDRFPFIAEQRAAQ